jgi:hypothetical protein
MKSLLRNTHIVLKKKKVWGKAKDQTFLLAILSVISHSLLYHSSWPLFSPPHHHPFRFPFPCRPNGNSTALVQALLLAHRRFPCQNLHCFGEDYPGTSSIRLALFSSGFLQSVQLCVIVPVPLCQCLLERLLINSKHILGIRFRISLEE